MTADEITQDDVIADTVLEADVEAEAPGVEAAIEAEDEDAAGDFAVEDDSVSEDTTEETN